MFVLNQVFHFLTTVSSLHQLKTQHDDYNEDEDDVFADMRKKYSIHKPNYMYI